MIGYLLAMVVDAMSGMITQVRLPWRDEMNAYYQILPLCDPGGLQPNRHTETPTHEYATIAAWSRAG